MHLWFHPLILGRGGTGDLRFGEVPPVGIRLSETTPLSDDSVLLSYETDSFLAESES